MKKWNDRKPASCTWDKDGSFVIENYNQSKLFSNFFPGVAGIWGIPMWVFYVNRGQCISSFGIEGKDKAIVEFQPANKAYRLTPLQGFRTFLKIKSGNKCFFWEPFQNNSLNSSFETNQRMSITSHDLTITENNKTLGMTVEVNYFTIADEFFPALVRSVMVHNTSGKKYNIEMIDGLPIIVPYGIRDWAAKNMCRTVEAWVKVKNLKNKAPYYHLNVEVNDVSAVTHITEGNFYFSFVPSARKVKLLDPIVEASCVFGHVSDYQIPEEFFHRENFKMASVQQTTNRTPSAMAFHKFILEAKKSKQVVSLIGHAHSQEQLKKIVKKATSKDFIKKKAHCNKDIIAGIKNYALTHSSSKELNQYCAQTFLDNVLRGGLPISLKTGGGNVAFNVFSRKHGDMERDYNYFFLAPTPFSQGNGNYRDVNQNRRYDVWFNKDVHDSSIINFLSLSQADGYNPLIVKGMLFKAEDPQEIDAIVNDCIKGDSPIIRDRLQSGFRPGELLKDVVGNGIALKCSPKEFLQRALGVCHKYELAEHGEGFWSDHWTYNLDLIESFLSIYPEELKALLLERKVFSFYHSDHYVLPRTQRYILTKNGVRQYHSVKNGRKEIRAFEKDNKLRIHNGNGNVYYTNLIVKLLCLVANKAATFDPSGIGIEMEADKPNWYDSLNGLPALLGSSISETLELKRCCLFLQNALRESDLHDKDKIEVFEELATFMSGLIDILKKEHIALNYWEKSNDLKERYRERVRYGLTGEETIISFSEVRDFLKLVVHKIDNALQVAKGKKGLFSTYSYHEVTEYDILEKRQDGCPYVYPKKFKQHNLPLFLEGFVHALRTEKDKGRAQKLYKKLKASELYDKKLKMYKVNASLEKETEEIGRTRIFPAGWLENESIWLHMEYKYLLELLKIGLYKEFYETFKDVLVPFLNPAVYGRSTLENSSFIVSSAHKDMTLHGQGFVARLSGSTAEIVNIWLVMNAGKQPFVWNKQKGLHLVLSPALPQWLFTHKEQNLRYLDKKGKWKTIILPKNTYAFNFMGSTLVVYHNPQRRDLFSNDDIKSLVLKYGNTNKKIEIKDRIIPAKYAKDVRDGKVERMDVYFNK